MKRILITGGAGFIGSHLVKKLIKNNEIFCLDNLFTGSENNIIPYKKLKNFTFLKHNVIHPILSIKKLDEIYHFACPASPPFYQKDPVYTLQTNFLGTLNVIKLAQKTQAKILFSSTSEVYGSPLVHPQKESYWGNVNPNGIRSCYDEGKRVAETLLVDSKRQYNLDIRIVRIFNTYGENMNRQDGRVVSNFINQALENVPITLYGDGMQTRSFCYIDDLISGIIKLMKTKSFSKGELPLINLGNPQEQTVKSLAEHIITLTQSKSKIVFKPLPLDDPPKRKPDISLAQKKLNWLPKTTLEKGLKKTIAFFKKLKQND